MCLAAIFAARCRGDARAGARVAAGRAVISSRVAVTLDDVGTHYDELDPFYRDIWGEHVHHGVWTTGRETPAQAVTALVDLVAGRLDLRAGQAVCDIGCGYGATAQMLAERHGVAVTGLTISAVQARIAAQRVPMAGRLDIRHADWLRNDLPDAGFAHAYAIESSEHMADKQAFFAQAFRTLQPGGRLAVCVWLARDGAGPARDPPSAGADLPRGTDAWDR